MIHTATDERIKSAFELEGLTAEDIAQDERLSVFSVKAKLMQVSKAYREACKGEPDDESVLNFTIDEAREAKDLILDTMRGADRNDGSVDWKLRSEMAVLVLDEKLGRRKAKSAMQGASFNILNLNAELKQVGELTRKAKAALEV